jgi:hypothetical protein
MDNPITDAELLIAPDCPHCTAVLAALSEMVKQGEIGQLTVINIARHPTAASDRNVRSVPWIRIGPLAVSGAHTARELRAIVQRIDDPAARQQLLTEQLETGQLDNVISACRRSPALLPALLQLAGNLDTPFAVRVGVGAVLEDLAGEGLLQPLTARLIALSCNEAPQVRADAAHYLGLVDNAQAEQRLRELVEDDDGEVRDIAAESLAGHNAD